MALDSGDSSQFTGCCGPYQWFHKKKLVPRGAMMRKLLFKKHVENSTNNQTPLPPSQEVDGSNYPPQQPPSLALQLYNRPPDQHHTPQIAQRVPQGSVGCFGETSKIINWIKGVCVHCFQNNSPVARRAMTEPKTVTRKVPKVKKSVRFAEPSTSRSPPSDYQHPPPCTAQHDPQPVHSCANNKAQHCSACNGHSRPHCANGPLRNPPSPPLEPNYVHFCGSPPRPPPSVCHCSDVHFRFSEPGLQYADFPCHFNEPPHPQPHDSIRHHYTEPLPHPCPCHCSPPLQFTNRPQQFPPQGPALCHFGEVPPHPLPCHCTPPQYAHRQQNHPPHGPACCQFSEAPPPPYPNHCSPPPHYAHRQQSHPPQGPACCQFSKAQPPPYSDHCPLPPQDAHIQQSHRVHIHIGKPRRPPYSDHCHPPPQDAHRQQRHKVHIHFGKPPPPPSACHGNQPPSGGDGRVPHATCHSSHSKPTHEHTPPCCNNDNALPRSQALNNAHANHQDLTHGPAKPVIPRNVCSCPADFLGQLGNIKEAKRVDLIKKTRIKLTFDDGNVTSTSYQPTYTMKLHPGYNYDVSRSCHHDHCAKS